MPEITQEEFGPELDRLMRDRGMTNIELGRAIRKHKDTVSRYRRADFEHGPPSYGIRKAIADALGLSPHHFEAKGRQEDGRPEIVPPAGTQAQRELLGGHPVEYWEGYREGLLRAAVLLRLIAHDPQLATAVEEDVTSAAPAAARSAAAGVKQAAKLAGDQHRKPQRRRA